MSPQSSYLAERLAVSGLAALLIDLRTADERALPQADTRVPFDIALRTDRLVAATDWIAGHPGLEKLTIGYFGANGGAAVVLAAAGRLPTIGAVVSCSGRLDLAGEALFEIRAPTLLIVGARDPESLALSRRVLRQLTCEAHLESIPDATHLFAEPGAWEQLASLTAEWFAGHLGTAPAAARPTA